MTAPGASFDHELRAFAVELFEHSGGVADWSVSDSPGTVVVPPSLVAAAQLPGEEFLLSTTVTPAALFVSLAGDFLDVAARTLGAAVPREGTFCIPDRYLTKRDLADKIEKTFGWQNSRARYHPAEPELVAYHVWTLHAALRSEDVWEGTFNVSVNESSGAVVELPDVFREPGLIAEAPSGPLGEPATYLTALAEGKRLLIAASSGFVRRVEQRLERDRKRLQDYYRALAREADRPKRRAAATPPSPDEIEAKKRAVDLELRRKLAELNENYAFRAELRPVVLARVRIPALVVPVVIQRKRATREYRLYWNSLLRQFEPLACHRCRRATFSATFTNDTVDLLCASCAEKT